MFTIKETLKYAYETALKNYKLFAVAAGLTLLLNSYAQLFQKGAHDNSPLTIGVVVVSAIALALLRKILEFGIIRSSIKIAEGKHVHFSELAFTEMRVVIYGILADMLFAGIFLGGLILLIVPGVIWAVKFQFYSYFIVEKGLTPMEALRESARITKGRLRNLFLFDLVLMVITILGAIAFIVGVFFALPLTNMSMVYVYRKLLNAKVSAA